jgi:TetR/AcrR family transcriptional repressor of nem operon
MSSETADLILNVAHKLLAERGFSAFSYADIAESIKIRKASIHYHFPSKTDLVVAVLKRHRSRMEAGLGQLEAGVASPVDRLKKYLDHWEVCIRSQSEPFCIAALLGAELPSLPDEVQAEVGMHFTSLRQWLARTLKAGVKLGTLELRGSADVEAEVMMAAVHGGMISARVNKSSTVFKQVTSNALQRVLVS